MGKFMRKSKNKSEASHHQSPLSIGVRTRAKTLALQGLGASPAPDGGSYLQLRSRRLEKITPGESKRQRQRQVKKGDFSVSNPSPNCGSGRLKGGLNSGSGCGLERKKVNGGGIEENSKIESNDLGTKQQEHVLDGEEKEKDKRETARCLDTMRIPCSATRLSNSADNNGTTCNLLPSHIITMYDMEEFFSNAEDEQQRQFIEKYNFDPVDEKPLPGRYEWVKVDP